MCSQAGGNPVYPRFSQPDNSESWDDVGNASDKRRQQESRVAMLLSLEKLTSVGRRLNWCGRQQHTSHYGENCVALRGQRANHA